MARRPYFPTSRRTFVLLFLPYLIGCGQKLASVEGTVQLDGKPLAAAGIAFHPVAGGPLGSATTDADGHFRIESANKPGLIPGQYQVTVVKKETSGFLADKSGLSAGIAPGGIKETWLVPQKYAAPNTSGLTADVKVGMSPLVFELKSQ